MDGMQSTMNGTDTGLRSSLSFEESHTHGFPIAIIGIGCRMPGGVNTPESFWEVISEGRETVTEIPEKRWHIDEFYDSDRSKSGRMVTRRAGFVDGVDQFDHSFFKISPREAASMDPHQRLMLEVVEESFEDAGIDPHTLKSDCGVFVGIGAMDYAINVIEAHHTNPYTITGISHCVTANRISYAFDLQGPSYTVDTACASSLTAIHLACTHIWNRECKVAVVGGCNTILIPEITIGFSVLGVLSPEGRCCPFSDNAKGYVRSEGWGSVILKPLTTALADDDHIYSVIKGSAIAANGFSGSLTMPLREAQEYVMHEAYNRFNLSKSLVDYVEAHGTGTPVGDPVEAAAIGSVFGSIRKETLKIGSGKSNFGHNEYAAGITAVIKTCLMLSKRFLCPTINYNYPNQNIDFKGLNLEVQTTRVPFLPNKLYRIGVNSFGFSGSVAHLVLEESPHRDYKTNRQCGWSFGGESEGEQILIPLSAKSKEAVDDLARKWLSFQHEGDALGVVAWQAMRRKHHDYRMVITAKSGKEFEQSLNTYFSRESIDSIIVGSSSTKQSKICMLFPGQGQQWISMGTQLYATEGIFREVISKCDAIFCNLSGWSIVNDAGIFLTKAPSKTATKIPVNSGTMIDEIEVCQPAILFLQIGLFHLLKHWGVNPHAVIGHSLGEVAAAYACGGMKIEEAIMTIYHRSKQQAKLKGAGAMAAFRQSKEETENLCLKHENLFIAAVNAPGSVTIAGDVRIVEEITKQNPKIAKQLRVQCAFHTPYMDPIKGAFLQAMEGVVKTNRAYSIPFYSTVDGKQYDGVFGGLYWWENIRNPVSFQDAMTNLIKDIEPDIIIECSASATLLSYVNQINKASKYSRKIMTIGVGQRGIDDRHSLLKAIGSLYVAGVNVEWGKLINSSPKWAPIPTYPWQHHSHWTESEERMKIRLGLKDRSFKGQNGQVSIDTFPYLADHIVEDKVVFPGAGYVEYGVEMFFGERENPALKNIRFLRTLIWPEDDRMGGPSKENVGIQATKNGSSIKISSEGKIHCTAEITSVIPHDVIKDISKIKQRCETMMSGVELYRKFASIGLLYGPHFRVIEQMMLGDEEAVAEIRSASDASQRVQTTLLDGCFQLVIASLGQFNTAYLPVKLDMLEMTVPKLPLDERIIAYAKVTDCDSTSITGDAYLCTSNGRVLVKVAGLMAKSLQDSNSGVDLESCLYTTEWQSVKSSLPPTSDVSTFFEEGRICELFPLDMHIIQKTGTIMPTIKKICKSYITHGLHMVDQSNIGERNEGYIRRLRAIADDTTVETLSIENIHKTVNEVAGMIPEISHELKMIKTFSDALPKTLNDPDVGVSHLLATESLDVYFAAAPKVRLLYRGGAEAIARAVEKSLRKKKVLRILEVGGGMAGLSKCIVSLLKDKVNCREVEYTCTGTSNSFFHLAKQCLKDFPLIKYKQLDIGKDIKSQGFIAGSFDIVVCLDAFHSAVKTNNGMRHMQNLLCEDGWLYMYETTNSNFMNELVFCPLWLCSVHDDVWEESCQLSRTDWENVFRKNGYTDVVSVSTPEEQLHSIVIGRKPTTPPDPGNMVDDVDSRWFLLGCNDDSVQMILKNSMQKPCTRIENPSIDDIKVLCTNKLTDVVYWCGEWDAKLHFLLELLKAMDYHEDAISSIYIITHGAYKDKGNMWSHAAFGLAGSACNHIKSGCVYYVDLDSQQSLQQNAQMLCTILSDKEQPERTLIIRENSILCQRIINAPKPEIDSKIFKYWRLEQTIHADGRGMSLDDMGFCALPNMTLKKGEVVVKIHAAALNFKDVMMAHGMLEGLEVDETRYRFGLECSGVVEDVGEGVDHLQVGDEVIAFAKTSFASHVISDARFVIPKPKHLSMVDSAGIIVAFTTAYHSLIERANLRKGETVLIHSACGGVGLSAIQIAKMQRAIIICTAGSEEKRAYLRNELDIKFVTDSRSDRFYHDVMKWTNGKGVNVVLNSLYGRLMERGLASLAPGGRYCEIGKRDILENSQLDMKTFLENKSFLSCQIDIRLQQDHDGVQYTLEQVVRLFEERKLNPIPKTVFHITDYLEAFRTMAKGQHIGKVVFEIGEYVPDKFELHGDILHEKATYLVTGAFGGIGQALVRWMQKMGAKHLVMVSRSEAKSAAAHRTLEFLKRKGVKIYTFAADVSDYDSIQRILDQLNSSDIPPLRGVFHLAGVVDETLLPDLTPEQFDIVMRCKAESAYHLHELTKEEQLDIFLLMSSVTTLRGQSSQPAYCAANAALDALAEYRHKIGLPALSLQMGAVRGAGYLEGRADTIKVLESQGFCTLHINEVTEFLGGLLNGYTKPVVCFANQDWTAAANFTHRTNLKFCHLMDDASLNKADSQVSLEDLENMVKQKLSRMIFQSPEDIDITKPMIDYGVDSLMAAEMVTWASKELGVTISQLDILGGISTSVLLEKAVEKNVVLPLMES